MQPVVVVVNNSNNVKNRLAKHQLQTYLHEIFVELKEIRKLDVCSFWRKIRA